MSSLRFSPTVSQKMPSWYWWRIAGLSAIRRAATVLPMPPPASVDQDRGHIL